MKIGKATVPHSAICASNEERIVVRGADLCDELRVLQLPRREVHRYRERPIG